MLNTYLRVIISSGSCSISLVSSNFIGLCVVVEYAELGFILIQAFGDLNLKWGFLVFSDWKFSQFTGDNQGLHNTL